MVRRLLTLKHSEQDCALNTEAKKMDEILYQITSQKSEFGYPNLKNSSPYSYCPKSISNR